MLPGEDDRSPSSGADSGEDRREEGVAILRVLIRPYSQHGVHTLTWFDLNSGTRIPLKTFDFNFQTTDATWPSG